MQVSVIGLGKLGAPWVAVLGSKGFDVTGVDRIPASVAALQEGRTPVAEPGLQALLSQSRGRIRATTSIKDATAASEVTFVVVPTPSKSDGSFSIAHVISAVEEIGAALRGKDSYHLVVITSTVMPGATGGPIRQALEASSGRVVGTNLGLCYNPEFIALGSVIHDMLQPDFILIGESDDRAGKLLASIYARVCDNRPHIQRMNLVNAEITKITVNSFVTAKISFANMISDICGRTPNADASTVLKAVGCDSRIGNKYLAPALGYGGPCFPRDNAAFTMMARSVGASADLADATDAINRRQIDRVASVVSGLLPRGTVGVLGLSYKPDTAVIEESQGIAIALRLVDEGYRVVAHDPQAHHAAKSVLGSKIEVLADATDCIAVSDLLVIATAWPAFRDIPYQAFRRSAGRLPIIDCWRLLSPSKLADVADLVYLGKHVSQDNDESSATAATA
jgi:UDPglucose 6-dehydrogenase